MLTQPDIHKAAGVLIKDGKFAVVKSKNFPFYITVGGKIEAGETVEQALVRELAEELGVTVDPSKTKFITTIDSLPSEEFDKYLQIELYHVLEWAGEAVPQAEIESLLWVDSSFTNDERLSSVLRAQIIPHLKGVGLIA
jgi:8-oxo-dGTP pyrophosphatase MutT (NUDIX family)